MTSLSAVFNVQREAWMEKGACKDQDPNIFVMDQGFTAARAITFCKVCTVREPCADYAVRTGSTGVWGGKLFTQRDSEAVELIVYQEIDDSRPRVSISHESLSSRPAIFGGHPTPASATSPFPK